jgi:hypothetical protein
VEAICRSTLHFTSDDDLRDIIPDGVDFNIGFAQKE